MYESIEPRVRLLVAEHLGVGPHDLSPEVSLIDDLAADSLDLVELALLIEEAFDVVIPERSLERIRTYGDLVDVASLLCARRRDEDERPGAATLVRTRVIAPGERGVPLERSVVLTPYSTQTILEDALGAGRGALLEVTAAASTTDAELLRIRERFTRLEPHGVGLRVRRDGGTARHHPSAA
jgi:acyl carrier protein